MVMMKMMIRRSCSRKNIDVEDPSSRLEVVCTVWLRPGSGRPAMIWRKGGLKPWSLGCGHSSLSRRMVADCYMDKLGDLLDRIKEM